MKTRNYGVVLVFFIAVSCGLLMVICSRRPVPESHPPASGQIVNYAAALDLYQLDNSTLPTTKQGLQALIKKPTDPPFPPNWHGPYLMPPTLRKDPWGRDYIYRNPGQHNTNGYDLYSMGRDGIDGSQDNIGNWQK
jgi:general secretion pathway protein G